MFRARDAAVPTARRIVQQELAEKMLHPAMAKARFGTWLDAIAKAIVRQGRDEGQLAATIVTSPTVGINSGDYAAAAFKAPDVWDTATRHAWDFMTAKGYEVIRHEQRYVGHVAEEYFGWQLRSRTAIRSLDPVIHPGLGGK